MTPVSSSDSSAEPTVDANAPVETPAPSSSALAAARKAANLDRATLVLAFIGCFISGYLSLAKLLHVAVPCGINRGCDVVTNHPSAYWFGVPVAYIGFLGYALLAGIATLRQMRGLTASRRLVTLGYIVAAGGTLTSVALQFYSLFVIRELCKWCMASAITMTATLIVYALLAQALDDRPAEVKPAQTAMMLPSGLIATLIVALGLGYFQLKSSPGMGYTAMPEAKVMKVEMIPANANTYGDASAPITIIEFADLMCPSCQQNSPRVKEFVRQHPGKIKIVYRHFPLPMHKLGSASAAMAEYAAEKGKFWDFALAVMALKREVEDPQELFNVAKSVNLDPVDIQNRLQNDNDPIYTRVARDVSAANLLGIQSTPTFIVQAAGVETRAYTGSGLFDGLNSDAYAKYMHGA